jgi:hypothetical protein
VVVWVLTAVALALATTNAISRSVLLWGRAASAAD